MTTPQTHGDTEAPLSGFDARLHQGFSWIQENAVSLGIGFGALLLLGVIIVSIVEYRDGSEAAAQTALINIELDFAQAMGAPPGAAIIEEPANEEIAKRSRETAISELDALIEEHSGSEAAIIAAIRAAEFEVDLGEAEAADARLAAVASQLADDDPRRAVALRLRGYTLEQRGELVEAGETYLDGASVETYPARALLLLAAAQSFERAGAHQRAVTAYELVLAASPEIAAAEGVLARMRQAEAKIPAASPTPASVPGVPGLEIQSQPQESGGD